MSIRWTTAFLDLPPAVHATGSAFWTTVTGTVLSPPRGDRDRFTTLLPADGAAFLRVQRLDGAPRVHLDLHVDDLAAEVARSEALGATVVSSAGHAVLRSPGGFAFCLVHERGDDDPTVLTRPTAWSGPRGSAALVDQICLDVPATSFAPERDFWVALTGWPPEHEDDGSELVPLARPDGMPLRVLLQRLGPDDGGTTVRAHLDLASAPHRDLATA
ncbi:MAG TPA: VOC family protein, partial [Cellulomonas sp.]